MRFENAKGDFSLEVIDKVNHLIPDKHMETNKVPHKPAITRLCVRACQPSQVMERSE